MASVRRALPRRLVGLTFLRAVSARVAEGRPCRRHDGRGLELGPWRPLSMRRSRTALRTIVWRALDPLSRPNPLRAMGKRRPGEGERGVWVAEIWDAISQALIPCPRPSWSPWHLSPSYWASDLSKPHISENHEYPSILNRKNKVLLPTPPFFSSCCVWGRLAGSPSVPTRTWASWGLGIVLWASSFLLFPPSPMLNGWREGVRRPSCIKG